MTTAFIWHNVTVLVITPRRIIAATIVIAVVTSVAITAVAVESYRDAWRTAWQLRASVHDSVSGLTQTVSTSRVETAAAVAAAQLALSNATGKTLDDSAPSAVRQAITNLQSAVDSLNDQLDAAQSAFASANHAFASDFWWPPTAATDVAPVRASLDLSTVDTARTALDTALQQLSAAEADWQAEQDRIAAAAAAAQAAARAAAAKARSSTLANSGGQTAPNETVVTDSQINNFDPEAYIHSIVISAVNITWVPNLCQTGYLCGQTVLGTATPTIKLDGSQVPAYSTQSGLYVLTHESAHARSWYLYGSITALRSTSVNLTGLTMNNGSGAIEWMADCATIAKIGVVVSGYAYTSTCTAPQLAEGARYWQ